MSTSAHHSSVHGARVQRLRSPIGLACLVMVLFLGALPSPAHAAGEEAVAVTPSDPNAMLLAAQDSFDQGMALIRSDPAEARRRFAESASLYAALVDGGANTAAIHFNLGNARFQAHMLGPAIASYLRAMRASPGDDRVLRNLAHARSQVSDRFERAGSTTLLESVATWWHVLSTASRLRLAAVAWVLLWLLVGLRILRPRLFAGEGAALAFRLGSGAAALVGVVLAITVAADLALEHFRPRGVIVEDGVIVRKGNGEGFEPQFQESLGEGVEFRVLDQRPGWVQIELPNGRSGWIREGEAEVI